MNKNGTNTESGSASTKRVWKRIWRLGVAISFVLLAMYFLSLKVFTFNPLLHTEKDMRIALLKITPIGIAEEEALQRLKHRLGKERDDFTMSYGGCESFEGKYVSKMSEVEFEKSLRHVGCGETRIKRPFKPGACDPIREKFYTDSCSVELKYYVIKLESFIIFYTYGHWIFDKNGILVEVIASELFDGL